MMTEPIRLDLTSMLDILDKTIVQKTLPVVETPLLEANGRILAKDLCATLDNPCFNNSALDGYALRTSDFADAPVDTEMTISVVGESTAGHPFTDPIPHGCAIRIMTGAPVPQGLDRVIPFEDTTAHDGCVTLVVHPTKFKNNIRLQGELFARGDVLLPAGTLLDVDALGLAASLGLATVACYEIKVGVFSSGDELLEPDAGKAPQPGKIYNANGILITLLARQAGAQAHYLGILPDDPTIIENRLRVAAEHYDILVSSAGVGPGDRDFTSRVLTRLGDLSLYHVRMRPGKAFNLARMNNPRQTLFLGLAGNPVAAETTARLYLQRIIGNLCGRVHADAPLTATCSKTARSRPGRSEFIRGQLGTDDQGQLLFTPHAQQSSASLLSAAQSNAMLLIEQDSPEQSAGTLARVRFTR